MCSSPKTSGSVRKSQIESIFGKMDLVTQTKITASANRAQERKEMRLARNSAQMTSKNLKSTKDKKVQRSFLLNVLAQLGLSV
tara:strand:- start:314 stop:562 length:249 start_codon:yes stop_codon:yes gene_type:complete